MSGLSYEKSGVQYDKLDAFKRACQRAAATTAGALVPQGISEVAGSRGESAYLVETADAFWAHVEEGLGTKNLVADAMERATGRGFYRNIGIDTVATIVNDLITCGALPVCVAMHAAVGESAWFEQGTRAADLAQGFAEGCRRSLAAWGGGETPALRGIVDAAGIVLAGSALGRIVPKNRRIVGDVRDGDAVVLLGSSGVHTNGLTLCRAMAQGLERGYLTPMVDGRAFGEGLLDASVIYVRFVKACQEARIALHYAVHITGHGWRKLMRMEEPFVYRLTKLGPLPAVFEFIQRMGAVDEREMYATFNMGAGFGVYVDEGMAQACVKVAGELGYTAWVAGSVHKQGNRKAVEILPRGIVFEADSLQVR